MNTLTNAQEKWLSGLSDDETVSIEPFDPASKDAFNKVREKLKKSLGKDVEVVHKGATSLKIAGKGELDVYIPVPPDEFSNWIHKTKQILGLPKSLYPKDRARFMTSVENTEVEVFVVNNCSQNWINSCNFEKYLKDHPKALLEYENIKKDADGSSVREYYTQKTIFINKILNS